MSDLQYTVPANTMGESPFRIGLQGPAGAGKTWGALTFPNPVYADLDNKLRGYLDKNPDSKFPVIQFWNPDLVVNKMKISNVGGKPNDPKFPPNIRDAFEHWLTTEAPKLTADQTLILDSWTSLQTAFDIQSRLPHEVSYSTKTGLADPREFWGRKVEYSKRIMDGLKRLKCHVVLICHEHPERDDNGRIIGIRVLMQGSFADELPTQLTDWYRARYFDTWADAQKEGVKEEIYQQSKGYLWQSKKTTACSYGIKSNSTLPDFIPANYQSLIKRW